MKRKLTSRKFWVAVAGVVSGILMIFGFADTSIDTIAGAVVIVGTSVGYMIAEGMADSANIKSAVNGTMDIIDTVKQEISDDEIENRIL